VRAGCMCKCMHNMLPHASAALSGSGWRRPVTKALAAEFIGTPQRNARPEPELSLKAIRNGGARTIVNKKAVSPVAQAKEAASH
jgi:hypothetical protein